MSTGMKAKKTEKVRETYSQTYRKGIIAKDHKQIMEILKEALMVHIIAQGLYSNDTQSITVKIDFPGDTTEDKIGNLRITDRPR